MTTHPELSAGKSQCAKIYSILASLAGQWVDMPALGRASGSWNVHSRISDLRKRGAVIAHKNEHAQGMCRSYYKLEI